MKLIRRTADELRQLSEGLYSKPKRRLADLSGSYASRLELATVGHLVALSNEGQLGVGVRPEELPTYILASRGSHQLQAVVVILPATSDASTMISLSCL
jgi:hypothetical protein